MAQPDRVIKRKLKYLYTDGAAGPATDSLRLSVDASSTSFSVSPDGALAAADGTSRMHIDFSLDDSQQLATVAEIHLADRRALRAPDLIDSLRRLFRA